MAPDYSLTLGQGQLLDLNILSTAQGHLGMNHPLRILQTTVCLIHSYSILKKHNIYPSIDGQ